MLLLTAATAISNCQEETAEGPAGGPGGSPPGLDAGAAQPDAGGGDAGGGSAGGGDAGGGDAGSTGCSLVDFTATPGTGTAPLRVQFATDLLVPNTVYAWSWELGDGTESSTEAPVRSYYAPGSYDVTVTVTDSNGSCSLTKPALVNVTEYSTTPVHVDPTHANDPDEDGSLAHPYDSWADVSFAAGGIYLQKRETVANEGIRITTSGDEGAPITLGAYGVGARPVLDGTGLGDHRGIYIGQWNAGGVVGYIDVSDFEIRNFQGYGVCTAPNSGHAPHHCSFTNLHIHGTRPLASGEHRIPGMYLWPTTGDWSDPLYNTVTHCHSEHNSEHGFKIASGGSLVDNCSTNDNGAHGVSCPLESHGVMVVGGTHHHNGSSGVELGGEASTAANVTCHNNGYGIEINERGDKRVRHALCYENDTYGVFVSCHLDGVLSGVTIERTRIWGNPIAGIRLRNGCTNVHIEKTAIYDNGTYGVILDQNSDYTGPQSASFELHYNLLYDNGTGFRVTATDGVSILNNTFYENPTEDVSLAASASNVIIRNNILQSIVGAATSDHNVSYLDEDPRFVDAAGRDFHLQSGAEPSPCVDTGLDVGLTEDFEGMPVPSGSAPDIGAYELAGP